MDIHFLISELQAIENAKKVNRERVANIVFNNQQLMPLLVNLTFETNNELSIRAAWVLEWVCSHKSLDLLAPHLDYFSKQISALKFDSAIRPCAKICELLAKAVTSPNENIIKATLSNQHIERIVETGFDWLITPQKIAVKAYIMETLFLFGLQIDWIHPELQEIIGQKISQESAGYKARGKKILSLIKKKQKK